MSQPPLGPITGRYAGAFTRLLGFTADSALVAVLFGLVASLTVFVAQTVLGIDISTEPDRAGWWLIVYAFWYVVYFWTSLAITGRTAGKWLVGVRVVDRTGSPLRPLPALIRVLVLPLSIALLGLGLVGIVVGREHRALHDVLAGSVVVYDWGDREATIPAPLTRWLERRGVIDGDSPPGV